MKAGISTACLYPIETEQALEKLLDLDFKLFEVFFNTYSEMKPQFLSKIRQMLNSSGASVKSVHPFTSGFETMMIFSDYERRFLDALEFYQKYFEAANELGAEILVLHGQRDYGKSRIPEELYFQRYARLYALGKEYGVTVAQENVNAFRSESPEFIRKMRRVLGDECSFVLDVKQAVRAGFDPYEMCAAMGERLVHVHINDNSKKTDCLLPGKGTMDYSRLLDLLEKIGYSGDLIIEVYCDSYGPLEELLDAKKITEDFTRKFQEKA